MNSYLAGDQLGVECYYGVPVCWIGNQGDVIAVTNDTRRGLAAINAFVHDETGERTRPKSITNACVRFFPGSDGKTRWEGEGCASSDPGATEAVVAFGVDAWWLLDFATEAAEAS